MFLKRYQPRNHTPWAIISTCVFVSAILILILRFMLAAENKKRDAEPYDPTYDEVYILETDSNGKEKEKRVDKVCGFGVDCRLLGTNRNCLQVFLDLTDKQNREFRYVL